MLLDISMPGCGLKAAREIQQESPNVKAVMLTASENENHVQTALQHGVNGYVVKGCSGPELLRIVRAVQKCEFYITPALAARLLTQRKKPNSDTGTPDTAARAHTRETRYCNCFRKGA